MRDFAQYFDGVFCLSLPSSTDRRQHIERHFHALGIEGYEFFDAVGPDDPEVKALYAKGKVASYPPCFRCGELSCGRDDCNNVLIPAQVATFVSFMNLWRHILEARVETALIVEDDVAFVDYAPRIADMIVEHRLLDQVGIRREEPMLLRLGWAAGPDHRTTGRVDFKPNHIKMSDPCYALNRAMAAKLLESFERVDTTVDIFIHQQVGSKVANFTLFPPLAAELSWSLGAVESLIHPKPIRVAYLKKHHPERSEEIQAAVEAVREHENHILYRDLLFIGHPHCGSGYMSKLLGYFGLEVGHERMGKRGISSWMFAVEDERNPFALDPLSVSRKNTHFHSIVHFVRNPQTAIPSIVREDRHSKKSYAFRRKHILSAFGVDLDAAQSEVERAMLSYVYWNKIVERQWIDLRVRVEEAVIPMRDFLAARDWLPAEAATGNPPPKDVNAQKLYQGKLPERPTLSEADWDDVDEGVKNKANSMCKRYGYPAVFE